MQEKKDWLSGYNVRKTAGLARKYHEGGFALEDSSQDVLAGQCNSLVEARGVWHDRGKSERYGIAAELIVRVISTSESHIRERPPFGLLKRITPSNSKVKDPEYQVVGQFVKHIDPFDQAKGYFTDTLLHAQAEAMGQFESASQDKTLYDRYLEWVSFTNKNGMGKLNPRDTLSNPIGHAADVMTDVLRVVPGVYKKERPNQDPSSSDLTNIASNSYSIVAYLASFELYSFKYAKLLLNGPLMDRSLSAEHFDLIEDGKGNIRLAFEDQIKHRLDKIRSDTNLMQGPRIGCPAMMDFGEGSAMQRLWRWHVSVGEAIYQNPSSRLT